MRSAVVLVGLVLLAGCERATTVEIKGQQEAIAVPSSDETAKIEVKLADPAKERRYQALGTEPFWSIDVTPGKLRYSSPENIDGTEFPSSESVQGSGTRYSGMMDGKAVVLVIEPGECSDGMSDTVYPYRSALTIDGKTEQGCARLK